MPRDPSWVLCLHAAHQLRADRVQTPLHRVEDLGPVSSADACNYAIQCFKSCLQVGAGFFQATCGPFK